MIGRARAPVDVLIEVGPSDLLASPTGPIKVEAGRTARCAAAAKRGPDSVLAMDRVAGQLFFPGRRRRLLSPSTSTPQRQHHCHRPR
jgi:hypothetical protein